MAQSMRQIWRQAWLDFDRALSGLELVTVLLCLSALLVCGLLSLGVRFDLLARPDELDRLMGMLALWTGMISASLAVRQPGHPGFDRLRRRLPRRWQPGLTLMLRLGAGLICLGLVWASLRYLVLDLRLGSSSLYGVPNSIWLVILPLGFLLMALRLVLPPDGGDESQAGSR